MYNYLDLTVYDGNRKLLVAQQTAKENSELEILNRKQNLDIQKRDSLVSQTEELEQRQEQLQERKQQLAGRLEKVKELKDSSVSKKADLEKQLIDYKKQTKIAE